jgi:hypothetical protein
LDDLAIILNHRKVAVNEAPQLPTLPRNATSIHEVRVAAGGSVPPAVLLVGGTGIDTILRVLSLPLALADSIHLESIRDYVAHIDKGGAVGLLALGCSTRLLDFVGVDADAGDDPCTLLPENLDDYVVSDNPVRIVDVFVDELDLGRFGFERVQPAKMGRPAYHPAVLLKLCIYDLNRIQSKSGGDLFWTRRA